MKNVTVHFLNSMTLAQKKEAIRQTMNFNKIKTAENIVLHHPTKEDIDYSHDIDLEIAQSCTIFYN